MAHFHAEWDSYLSKNNFMPTLPPRDIHFPEGSHPDHCRLVQSKRASQTDVGINIEQSLGTARGPNRVGRVEPVVSEIRALVRSHDSDV